MVQRYRGPGAGAGGVELELAVGGKGADAHRGKGRAFDIGVGAKVAEREHQGRVLGGGDRVVGRGGRGVAYGCIPGAQVAGSAEGGGVGDLEADGGVGAAVLVQIGGEAQPSGRDVGIADHLVQRDRGLDAGAGGVELHPSPTRRSSDLHRGKGRAFDIGVGAKVAEREHQGRVLGGGDRVVGRGGRIVHRGDVGGERVAGSAEGGAVGDLGDDGGVGAAVLVQIGGEAQPPGGDVGSADHLVQRDPGPGAGAAAVELELAVGVKGADSLPGRRPSDLIGVGAKVAEREHQGRVLGGGDRVVGRGGRIVHRGYVGGERVAG